MKDWEKDIPEIDLTFTSERIVAKTRKLKSNWRMIGKNGCIMLVKGFWRYWFYKILWEIKPPKPDYFSYCDFYTEEEKKIMNKQIRKNMK